MAGRQDYEERRQARIDRLNAAAETAAAKSIAESRRASELVEGIPFGQPNIIGRPALPALRARSARCMDRSVEQQELSEEYKVRAEAAVGNRTISADDPDAIEKLKAKVSALEAERERIKAHNKEAKKNGTETAPWYALPYIARDIKAATERIAKLERIDAMPAELIEFDGGEIESDPVTNRVIIRYDERQDAAVTDMLKSNGFKWAPSAGGWQRLRTPGAWRLLCRIMEKPDDRRDK